MTAYPARVLVLYAGSGGATTSVAEFVATRPRAQGVVPHDAFPPVSRLLLRLLGGRYGDLRDWPAVGAWATSIARYPHGAVPRLGERP